METSGARNLMSDEEWAFFLALHPGPPGPEWAQTDRPPRVSDGIFWISRTEALWRDLPEEFGKWSSVYRQFRRWTLAGRWEDIMEALDRSGAVPDALQMIDSAVVRAHHQAAGSNGGLRDRVSAVLVVGSRSRSICSSTRMASP